MTLIPKKDAMPILLTVLVAGIKPRMNLFTVFVSLNIKEAQGFPFG